MSSERKLSKLQKFILIEAVKTLPEIPETVKAETEYRRHLASFGFAKPGAQIQVQPQDIAHITRGWILAHYFELHWRKQRLGGFVMDWDSDRIDAESDPARYNRANATLYRAIRRLETRGLIRRMNRLRAGLQLTEKGIVVAAELNTVDLNSRNGKRSGSNSRASQVSTGTARTGCVKGIRSGAHGQPEGLRDEVG